MARLHLPASRSESGRPAGVLGRAGRSPVRARLDALVVDGARCRLDRSPLTQRPDAGFLLRLSATHLLLREETDLVPGVYSVLRVPDVRAVRVGFVERFHGAEARAALDDEAFEVASALRLDGWRQVVRALRLRGRPIVVQTEHATRWEFTYGLIDGLTEEGVTLLELVGREHRRVERPFDSITRVRFDGADWDPLRGE